jgi:hypothetical protein
MQCRFLFIVIALVNGTQQLLNGNSPWIQADAVTKEPVLPFNNAQYPFNKTKSITGSGQLILPIQLNDEYALARKNEE